LPPKYGGEPPESEPCAKIVPIVSSALILTSGLHKARVAGSSLPPVLFIFTSPAKVASPELSILSLSVGVAEFVPVPKIKLPEPSLCILLSKPPLGTANNN
tara:strand:+ start:1197 stop:1499 length:303 start_codon:yes stop_codon:yes gene_type:complete